MEIYLKKIVQDLFKKTRNMYGGGREIKPEKNSTDQNLFQIFTLGLTFWTVIKEGR